jgi:hypothetical protein
MGYFGHGNLQICSIYGIVLLVVSVWVAFHMKKPKKDD